MEEVIILKGIYRIIDARYKKQGSYGAVFRALNMQNNQIVAVKEIMHTIGQEGIDPTVIRQKAILNLLDHKNIVVLIESFIQDKKAYLVFPYFEMNLREIMRDEYKLQIPDSVVKKIMSQLLSALKIAHSSRIMHRDLKPENIMVQKLCEDPSDFNIKLADWGASRKLNAVLDQNFTVQVIAIAYRPPELFFKSRKYSQTVDIWSVGCLFYELLMRKRLFDCLNPNQILYELIKNIGLSQVDDEKWIVEIYKKFNFECTEEILKDYRNATLDSMFENKFGKVPLACDLIKKMLRLNPEKRISASDCLKHPYFDFNN